MIGLMVIGVCAGVVAGLLGVGGGVLFVPGLVIFMNLGQHQAEATSLLAIIPVAIVGTFKQDGYGNVRRHDALLMGLLSLAGAATGVALANALSGEVLRVGFALLMVIVAIQLARKALGEETDDSRPANTGELRATDATET
ncbi:MAG TPA: sulfite exporter TauE/SafE family protein [Solirubrobacteraceae bacterium]